MLLAAATSLSLDMTGAVKHRPFAMEVQSAQRLKLHYNYKHNAKPAGAACPVCRIKQPHPCCMHTPVRWLGCVYHLTYLTKTSLPSSPSSTIASTAFVSSELYRKTRMIPSLLAGVVSPV